MNKNTLSEIALYHGDIAMPKNFEIDRDKLSTDILQSDITDSPFPFSRNWDMLNTYMRDHFSLNYEQTSQNEAGTHSWSYSWDEDAYQADNTAGWVLADSLA